MDIKELLRTYVVLNDPNVKEVTRKFGALLLGLGVATLGVWGMVTLAEGDDFDADPRSGTAAGSDDGSAGDGTAESGSTETECVDESEADAWRHENRWVLLENRLVDTEERDGQVCYTYET